MPLLPEIDLTDQISGISKAHLANSVRSGSSLHYHMQSVNLSLISTGHRSGVPALTVNFCNVQSHYLSLTRTHLVTF